MNLTVISQFIKKYTGIILASAAVIILIFAITIIYLNKKISQLPLLNPPQLAIFSIKVKSLDTQNLNEPKNIIYLLPTYAIKQNNDFLKESAALASKLGIDKSPIQTKDVNLGQGNIYAGQNSVLSVYKNSISYQKLNLKPQKGKFNKDQAAEIAKKYLSSLGLDTSRLNLAESKLEAIVGDNIVDTQDPNQADQINLNFGYTFSEIPTITNSFATNASVDISGQVTSFNFSPLENSKPLSKYPLIKYAEAVQALQNGKGSIILIEGLGGYASQISSIDKVTAYNPRLAYFIPADLSAPIQPIWAFDGQATVNNSQVYLTFALPAIQEKFFKKPETVNP